MNCSIMWFLCSTVASDAMFAGFLLLLFVFRHDLHEYDWRDDDHMCVS